MPSIRSSARFAMRAAGALLLLAAGAPFSPVVHAAGLPCTPTLSRTQLELGDIAAADIKPALRPRDPIAIARQTTSLDIICGTPASFALMFRALPGPADTHRLGSNRDAPLLRLTLSKAQVDGKPATLSSTADPARQADILVLMPGDAVRAHAGVPGATASRLSVVIDTEILVDADRPSSGADRDLAATGFFEIVGW